MYRLYAILPSRFYNGNPHHILWNPVQILLATVSNFLGYPGTVPFQIFGILVNCTTLYVFYLLLCKTGRDSLFALVGVLFLALSPSFWYLGLQNEPYPLAFLAMVSYLQSWSTSAGDPPVGWRLAIAGLSLAIVIFFQQGAIVLIPPAMLVLTTHGKDSLRRRILRGAVWGAAFTGLVLAVYVFFWAISGNQTGLLQWSIGYLQSVHPLQLRQLGFMTSFARSAMGLSAALFQSDELTIFLGKHLSASAVVTLYASIGLLVLSGIAALVWWTHSGRRLMALMRHDALFAVSLLSVVFWWAFCFIWEPGTPHYWVLSFFPALVCLGLAIRENLRHRKWLLVTAVVLLSGWNGIFNYRSDLSHSRNFPDPLLAAINEHVGTHDIFVVLGDDEWFGNMDYHLLFQCLKYSPRNPGIAIFNDYVIPARGAPVWQVGLREKISSTLDSGGKVFVATHVFDPRSYVDLTAEEHPFSEQINEQYLGIEGRKVFQQVQEVFKSYNLIPSDFKIGTDSYFFVRPK